MKRRGAGLCSIKRRTVVYGTPVVLFVWWLLFSVFHEPGELGRSRWASWRDQHPFPPPLDIPPEHHPSFPPLEDDDSPKVDWGQRADRVKKAFQHAYHSYEAFASPKDEILPLSNGSINNFNGWGVSAIDSLDTMFLMGLHEEYERGVKIAKIMNMTADQYNYAPFFETTIRYLGGLLSAYAMSHDVILLQRADELAHYLLPVFNTTSGYPVYSVNPVTGMTLQSGWNSGWLAEIGTCQMEYKYLAHLTGKKEYYDVAHKINTHLHQANTTKIGGMFPTLWNLTSGEPQNEHVSIGAMADSGYEYLLKQYLLTSQTDKDSLEMYVTQANLIIENLLYLSPKRNLLYVTDVWMNPTGPYAPSRKFEHLSCFLPGLLALGAYTLPDHALPPSQRERHWWAAKGLTRTCWLMYHDQPTGLGPEEVTFMGEWELENEKRRKEEEEAMEVARKEAEAAGLGPGEEGVAQIAGAGAGAGFGRGGRGKGRTKAMMASVNQTEADEQNRWIHALQRWREEGKGGVPPGLGEDDDVVAYEDPQRDYRINNQNYLLRPETLESIYIMWRTTGEKKWRERGWQIFEALEAEAKTTNGYATLFSVMQSPAILQDSMPSFFLAETLKYLYLMFSETDLVPLDRFVFNTEAHPLPVFRWTDWEKRKFGVP
ncbi:seven-hairpin glycosidase [Rickenella mellea]|uniref:alpha-1,2-Mannosidase n=1 Tax=Rickenella mellea TaxID=50990 RepID=A0A4Y7Q9T3_9AGAM|nr:seven-hairpin glycosidase [Rickenella mellea]